MKYYYAGIGSRETPHDVLELFEDLGGFLARKGFVLRSGHAEGSDKAFEDGCDTFEGEKEIYLPWEGYEGSNSTLYEIRTEAYGVAELFHPNWKYLKEGQKKLMARNSFQVLGADLKTPSCFIMCWTEGGELKGGTSQAIRIANGRANNIPVFNAGKYKDIDEMFLQIKLFLIENTFLKKEDFSQA